MFKKAVCFELDKIKKSDIFYSIFFDVIFVLILMFTLVNDKKLVNTNKICRAGATKEALLLIDKFELSLALLRYGFSVSEIYGTINKVNFWIKLNECFISSFCTLILDLISI